jgi:hypothetical protein
MVNSHDDEKWQFRVAVPFDFFDRPKPRQLVPIHLRRLEFRMACSAGSSQPPTRKNGKKWQSYGGLRAYVQQCKSIAPNGGNWPSSVFDSPIAPNEPRTRCNTAAATIATSTRLHAVEPRSEYRVIPSPCPSRACAPEELRRRPTLTGVTRRALST